MNIGKLALLLLTATPALVQARQDSIYWETNLSSAYQEAMELHQPLVVYFREERSFSCILLEAALNQPGSGAFIAQDAVFVRVTLGHDDDKGNVGRMAAQLNIKSGPVVAVMDVSPSLIVSRGERVVYSREALLNEVTRLIRRGNR